MRSWLLPLALGVPLVSITPAAHAQLVNGGFEQPVCNPAPNPDFFCLENQSNVDGWQTTASDNLIEIRRAGTDSPAPVPPGTNLGNYPAYEGNQYAELNANEPSTLFQDVTGISAGSFIGWQFAHRGRYGADTMDLRITDLGPDNQPGGGDDTDLFTRQFTTNQQAWQFYFGRLSNPAIGNTVRFAYESVSGTSGIAGNYIDAANFGLDAGFAVPGPLPVMGAAAAFGFSRRLRRRTLRAGRS